MSTRIYEHRKRSNATEKQLMYWNSMIGKIGNGFQKGHLQLNTGKTYFTSERMKGNTYGFKKNRKVSQKEVQQKIKTRTLSGWNKNQNEVNKKISKSLLLFFEKEENRRRWSIMNSGEKNPMYNGGLCKQSYPMEFNERLKQEIRLRDKNICQRCGMTKEESFKRYNRNLCINHINFDKNDCREENLNTLCIGCNVQINNKRMYWQKYFQIKMIKQYAENTL